jgi:hypothetical protein
VTHSTTQTNILHRDKKAKLVVVALVVMAWWILLRFCSSQNNPHASFPCKWIALRKRSMQPLLQVTIVNIFIHKHPGRKIQAPTNNFLFKKNEKPNNCISSLEETLLLSLSLSLSLSLKKLWMCTTVILQPKTKLKQIQEDWVCRIWYKDGLGFVAGNKQGTFEGLQHSSQATAPNSCAAHVL